MHLQHRAEGTCQLVPAAGTRQVSTQAAWRLRPMLQARCWGSQQGPPVCACTAHAEARVSNCAAHVVVTLGGGQQGPTT